MVDADGDTHAEATDYLLLSQQQTSPRRKSNTLAAAGVSFNGCPVVLNTGHWDTVSSTVQSHIAGGKTFNYTYDTKYDFVCCDGHDRYFIEGCEAALDSPGEWSYAANEPDRLLFRPPDGTDPSQADVRGKNQTYALVFHKCENVELRGITFFATTILMF